MFGFGIIDYIKMGASACVGALVAGSAAYWIGHNSGDSAGYTRYAAEQTAKYLQAEKDRKKNDWRLQNLSNYDFCVDSLNRRGLPIGACDELRGIPTE